MTDMFENMHIPWTPRLRRRQPAPEPAATAAEAIVTDLCPRTLHLARAIVAHALADFPEAARAISAAFVAFIRNGLTFNLTGEPSQWTVVPKASP